MRKKYDLLFVTNLPSFYKVNLYNELSKKCSIKVIFLSFTSEIRSSDFSSAEINFDYEVLSSKDYEKRNIFSTALKLIHIICRVQFHKVIFSGWESRELLPIMIFLPRRLCGIVIESSIIESKTKGFFWLLKKIVLKNMSVAFPSGFLQQEILNKAKFKGIIKVTHGVGVMNKHSERLCNSNYNINSFKYLYVGRMAEEKNLRCLVNLFNKSKKSLTMVGGGPLFEELKKTANNNIKFLGYINNKNLADIYLSHDIFILPSNSEPWGLVIDEALWFGLPVVVSCNVGCSEDLVIKAKTGTVFDLNNDFSFNNALSEVELNYSKYKKNVMKIDFDKRDQDQIDSYLS